MTHKWRRYIGSAHAAQHDKGITGSFSLFSLKDQSAHSVLLGPSIKSTEGGQTEALPYLTPLVIVGVKTGISGCCPRLVVISQATSDFSFMKLKSV